MKPFPRIRNATPLYTLLQGLYWAVYCVLVSFSSVYLLDRGFSNTQIGVLVGVSSVLSALMQPLAASVAERSRRLALRQWSALLALVMAAGAVLLLVLPGKGGQAACYMLLLVQKMEVSEMKSLPLMVKTLLFHIVQPMLLHFYLYEELVLVLNHSYRKYDLYN